MQETDIAWLAGLLEGEGCFRVQADARGGARRPCLRCELHMTDRDVVERAHELMAPTAAVVRERPSKGSWKTSYRTRATGVAAERVMRLVRPYMGQRRGVKIDELLALTNLSHHPRQKEVA